MNWHNAFKAFGFVLLLFAAIAVLGVVVAVSYFLLHPAFFVAFICVLIAVVVGIIAGLEK